MDKSAATAYKLNNPRALVFNEDCNHILRNALDGIEIFYFTAISFS